MSSEEREANEVHLMDWLFVKVASRIQNTLVAIQIKSDQVPPSIHFPSSSCRRRNTRTRIRARTHTADPNVSYRVKGRQAVERTVLTDNVAGVFTTASTGEIATVAPIPSNTDHGPVLSAAAQTPHDEAPRDVIPTSRLGATTCCHIL